jgi:cyclase
MRKVIGAGAQKVSGNSAAVLETRIISQGASAFGSQCVVLGMDVKKVDVSGQTPEGIGVKSLILTFGLV